MYMKHIDLFAILGNEGGYGLINYLQSRTDKELKILANQYSVEKSVKAKDEIIKGILFTVERTMNIGYVFTKNQLKLNLVDLYK